MKLESGKQKIDLKNIIVQKIFPFPSQCFYQAQKALIKLHLMSKTLWKHTFGNFVWLYFFFPGRKRCIQYLSEFLVCAWRQRWHLRLICNGEKISD